MTDISLHLLGPPRIERDGEPVLVRRRKAVALLAYLAVTRQVHSRDVLAALLWPEADRSSARAGLRRALAALKRALGDDVLHADRESIALCEDADLWLDVRTFRDRVEACRTHNHPQDRTCAECLSRLREAAALHRDDFLAGFGLPDSPAFDEWQFFETEGLRNELAGVLEELARALGDRGEPEQAVPYARRWVALDPLHEPAHRCLMQLYADAGQRAAALRQYGECERVLRAELDAPPAEETVRLCLAIREDRGQAVVEPPDGANAGPVISNLPVSLTPFVGREHEMDAVSERLHDPDCRLLTLTGPGGVGKTRLALEAARGHAGAFADGACFVPLAPLQSVDAILLSVAQALNFAFHRSGDPQRQVIKHLGSVEMLLILDNLEHLLDGTDVVRRDAADVVTEILRAAPGVKILATSRARLGVHGEHLYVVPGMDYLDASSAPSLTDGAAARHGAVELFLTSARRVDPDFAATDEARPHVVEICRLVEGLPLAIEMAAAWVGVLSPAEVAAEIRESLDILRTDLRGVPADGVSGGERHRSIRAVFDHSWELLSQREKDVFQGLSVFRGSFSRAYAGRVVGALLGDLVGLVHKSLLTRVAGSRFQVHELLRRYGAEKLGASPDAGAAVRDRHSAFYADTMAAWDIKWSDPRWPAAAVDMDLERENARAAWDWAVARGNVDRLGRSVAGLCHCYSWPRRRLQEGEAACGAAAKRLASMVADGASGASDARRVLANVLAWQATYSLNLGSTERARELQEQSVAMLRSSAPPGHEASGAGSCVLLELGLLLERARAADQSIAFMIADIDDFRRVNNVYGHATGDRVLAGVWHLLEGSVEGRGILRRWGGEEFSVVLPEADERQAVEVAEQIRRDIEGHTFQSDDGREVRVTISIGIAMYPRVAQDLVSLHGLADRAVYRAKEQGKNRVLVYGGNA